MQLGEWSPQSQQTGFRTLRVKELLEYVRACLGQPQITDFTDYMSKYFRGGRRQPQESMNSYITRKMDVYLRAQSGLARVQAGHKAEAPTDPWSCRSGSDYGGWNRQHSQHPTPTSCTTPSPTAEAGPRQEAPGTEQEAPAAAEPDAWSNWTGSDSGYYQPSWSWWSSDNSWWSRQSAWGYSAGSATRTSRSSCRDGTCSMTRASTSRSGT